MSQSAGDKIYYLENLKFRFFKTKNLMCRTVKMEVQLQLN